MSMRPETTKEYFQMYGFQEFKDNSHVQPYVKFLKFLYETSDWDIAIEKVLTTVQDYIRDELGLRFNGYYFGSLKI